MTMITLTDAAVMHIQSMLEKQKSGIGFRLSIKKTGCSGYAYVPAIIEKINERDIHFTQDNLDIYVDPASESFIRGVVIDFVSDTDSLGLKQKRLVFMNPNEKNRCGCGESFTIE
ncbi:MAG TPA: iron-sulfur cluster assembly accessory protein [Gammaproteobacteria bacterium]|nr:iron-sulfur cluster assembly accessory protein [Gammaproteobacteria bacterium]